MDIPLEYRAILRHAGGETEIDLSEPGWRTRPEMDSLVGFTLKPVGALPPVAVDLAPLADGAPRRLIYFSRVVGRFNVETGDDRKKRLYCVGWQATVAGRNVQSKLWIYWF